MQIKDVEFGSGRVAKCTSTVRTRRYSWVCSALHAKPIRAGATIMLNQPLQCSTARTHRDYEPLEAVLVLCATCCSTQPLACEQAYSYRMCATSAFRAVWPP